MLILYGYLIYKYIVVFNLHFNTDGFENLTYRMFAPWVAGAAGSSFIFLSAVSLYIDLRILLALKTFESDSVRKFSLLYIALSAFVVFIEPWIGMGSLDPSAYGGFFISALVAARSWAGGFFAIIFCSIPYAYLWFRHS